MVTPQFITSESKLPASYFSPLPVAEIYERHMKGTQDARLQFVLRAENSLVSMWVTAWQTGHHLKKPALLNRRMTNCLVVQSEQRELCTVQVGRAKTYCQSQVLVNETWGTQRVHTFTARMATYFCYW